MSIWSQGYEIASQTTKDRNRYVDFLRALSILFVISGHWLMTTAFFNQSFGELTSILILDEISWTKWLTWLFQIMPIFFIVGGYSNAISLESARKKNIDYAGWLSNRLHRLLTPLLVLIVFWAFISFVLTLFGVQTELIIFASKTALVPTWFLAIYTLIVLLAPATYAFWRRWGFTSLMVYVVLAILVDLAFFNLGWEVLGWLNYFWVWLAMHHLGFVWRDRRFGNAFILCGIAILSFLTLIALIYLGPYPIAMAGSPGDEVSNTLPPKITLIALGLFQFSLLLIFERLMQRKLQNPNFWTFTVIINTMIMTVYLWHMTILIALLAILYLLGGVGLTLVPGSIEWWWTRPIWIFILIVMLLPVSLLLSPMERISRPKNAPVLTKFRLIFGAILAGCGIAMTTLLGFDGEFLTRNDGLALMMLLCGSVISGLSIKFK